MLEANILPPRANILPPRATPGSVRTHERMCLITRWTLLALVNCSSSSATAAALLLRHMLRLATPARGAVLASNQTHVLNGS